MYLRPCLVVNAGSPARSWIFVSIPVVHYNIFSIVLKFATRLEELFLYYT